MEADLKVQPDKVCEESLIWGYWRQSMICAGHEDGKKSAFSVSVLGFKLGMTLGQ